MHFLSEHFVNKRINHLLGENNSTPVKSSSYKNFVPMIPFKIIFFVLKKVLQELVFKYFCLQNLHSFHSFLYLMKEKVKLFIIISSVQGVIIYFTKKQLI